MTWVQPVMLLFDHFSSLDLRKGSFTSTRMRILLTSECILDPKLCSWVAGTMVACLSSVRVLSHWIPSQFLPLLKHACREVTGHHAGHQEVGRCSPRGDITRNQTRGTSGPKIGHVYVSTKIVYNKKPTNFVVSVTMRTNGTEVCYR